MRGKICYSAALLALAALLTLAGVAEPGGTGKDKDKDKDSAAPSVAVNNTAQDDHLRVEGETRFHANCGRCHAAPPKFPARMMGTIIRHMRVRATVTDEDMRSILHYMTQ